MKGIRFTLSILATSLLAACGGGGGDGGSDNADATPASTQVAGTASKGIISNAVITAYALNSGLKGSSLGQAITGSDGRYSLNVGGHTGPILLEMTATGDTRMKCDVPTGCGGTAFGALTTLPAGFILRSALQGGSGTIQAAITPFTDLATQYAQSLGGGLNAGNISTAMTQIADIFDLSPLTATQPVDITAANLGTNSDAQRYALLNAAIAQLAGTPDQIDDVIDGLASELLAHGGQLINNSSTSTSDLGSVLEAAEAISLDPLVTDKLVPLVTVVITESLIAAIDAGETATTASGASSDGSALDHVKAFVAQTHDLMQSVLQADNEAVQSEIDQKLATISLLADDPNDERNKLAEALSVSHELMLQLAYDVERNGATDTSLSYTEANTLLPDLGYNDGGRVDITLENGFSVTLNSTTRIASVNGPITVQLYDETWNCTEFGCVSSRVAVGVPVTVQATNLSFSYPALNTANSSFFFGIAANGSLASSKLKLDLSAGSGSGLTANYAESDTLSAHMDALEDDDYNNDAAHTPNRVQLMLTNAKLTALGAPSTHYSQFTGSLKLDLQKAELPLVNGLVGTQHEIVPSLLSVAGSFGSAAGESLEASASIDLDDSTPFSQQALVSPDEGFTRDGLFNLTYDSDTETATFSPTIGYSFYSSQWWNYDAFQVRLTPDEYGYYCGVGNQQLEIIPLTNGTPDYPWTINCYAPDATLTSVLSQELALHNYYSSLHWYLGISIPDEGWYSPVIGNSIASGPLNGALLESDEQIVQNASHFVRGAFSATLKLKLGGSANLDTEVSISGYRSSLQGGNITATLKNNGKWLRLTAAGTDLATTTNLTVTNQDGVNLTLNPQNLNDEDDTNDSFELVLNGVTYGKVYELAGALVARFNDNSFTLL